MAMSVEMVSVAGNILKKAFIDAMLRFTGTSNTPDLPIEHSNGRRHFVCIVNTLLLYLYGRVAIYIQRGVFVARSSVRASSKASVMELATMKVPRWKISNFPLCSF